VNKIFKHKNKKIWLTVDVNTTTNTTFTLIQNLPFNTSDINDVLIVLKDRYKSNLLLSKVDMLNSITFTYHIKDRDFNPNLSVIRNICVYVNSISNYWFILLWYF